ncbi:MAG: transferase [Acidobacteria bacterium]|nr:transferase [Acidobacteriota bacterium]
MVARRLVTTALEDSWGQDQPLLFLGEWCRRFSRREQWEARDAVVAPYHWDDRAQLHADYDRLRQLHERLLIDLSQHLNAFHRVDHSVRYWRILVGPWLGYYVQMVFDRWQCLMQATTSSVSDTVVFGADEPELVPNDMAGFQDLFVNDAWNHQEWARIIRECTSVPRQEEPWPQAVRPQSGPTTARDVVPGCLGRLAALAGGLARDRDFFFLATYLPLRQQWGLSWRLRQVPQHWRSPSPDHTAVRSDARAWVVPGESVTAFEAYVRTAIARQLPTAYLEGYPRLATQAAALPWPSRPRAIWTSNAFSSDDVFKAWAAAKVDQGVPLVIGQHGGHYGAGRWSFTEDHEVAISDRFFSWGWSSDAHPHVTPIGQLKAKTPVRHQAASGHTALLTEVMVPRFSYLMFSATVSRQWLDYLDEQFRFVAALSESIRSALVVRPSPQDWGWDCVERWNARWPGLTLDDGRQPIDKAIKASRVSIATYNATIFLETMAMNVPTVMFWNPRHWELRAEAEPYWREMQNVGIFHDTPESAAAHVSAIWDDPRAWWDSLAVQAVVAQCVARFAATPPDLVARIARELEAVAQAGPRMAHVPAAPVT